MHNYLFALALGVGFSSGLRTFTAPAVVCWAAHLGSLNLHGSALAFLGSKAAVVVFTLLALCEYVFDLLPKAPNRTDPGSLIARIVSGGLCGASLSVSAGQAWAVAACLGGDRRCHRGLCRLPCPRETCGNAEGQRRDDRHP